MEIKKYLRLAYFAAIVCCLIACKKESNTLADYERPVVEGYLIPGKAVLIKVYYQKYLEDTISYGFPITGLKLIISDGTKTIALTESTAGNYVYADSTFIADQKSYTLSFEYNNKTISAQTKVPDKPTGFKASAIKQYIPELTLDSTAKTFEPVTFSWDNPTSDHFMLVFKNTTKYPTQVNTRFTMTYRDTEVILGQVSAYETQQMTFNFLGNYTVLLYHIDKAYSDALSNNGGSSLNLTTPNTNVVNGLGIFTAMRADTLKLLVYQ